MNKLLLSTAALSLLAAAAPAQALCSGFPAPGNVTGAPAFACDGVNYTLGLQNATPGTDVTYLWEYSADDLNWSQLGMAPTQVISQSATTYYRCTVGCTPSGSSVTTASVQIDMDPTGNPQDFEAGFTGCWTNSGGTVGPGLRPVSAFGVGAQAVRFNFRTWGAGNTAHLTGPVLLFPTGGGDRAFFDVAGTNYPPNLASWDTIALQESNDGGVTWATVVTMTNQPGGVLYTAPYTGQFTPTASQWKNRSFALTPGTNRIRFLGTSGFGNDAFIDNVVVGSAGYARHYQNGAACVPGYEITATPAPIPGTPVVWTAHNIPQWVSQNFYASALAVGFAADVPGTSLLTASFGQLNSPCLAHLTLGGLVNVFFLPNNVPNDTWAFTIPPLAPLGVQLFVQGVAQVNYVFPTNPAGLVTSKALETYVSVY